MTIAKDTGKATVLCALCNLKDEFQAHPAAQMIDVYSYFTDRFYGVKDPRPIIPRERATPREVLKEEEIPSEPAAQETAIVESSPQPPMIVESVEEPIVPASKPVVSVQAAGEPAATAGEQTEQAGAEASETKEAEAGPEEDNEPFADILQNKDKKRYSPNPLPEQSSD